MTISFPFDVAEKVANNCYIQFLLIIVRLYPPDANMLNLAYAT